MIRLSLIYAAFLILAAGVIFLRPGGTEGSEKLIQARSASPEVTRQAAGTPTTSLSGTPTISFLRPAARPNTEIEVVETPVDDEYRQMTTGILASLGAEPLPEAKPVGTTLRTLSRPQVADGAQTTRTEDGTLVISLVQSVSAPTTGAVEASGPSITLRPALPKSETATATPKRVQPVKRTHQVQRGESLASISIRYYGDKDGWKKIFEANKAKLKDPELIKVGQVLVIPSKG